jgi:hypothetical protein
MRNFPMEPRLHAGRVLGKVHDLRENGIFPPFAQAGHNTLYLGFLVFSPIFVKFQAVPDGVRLKGFPQQLPGKTLG